MTPEILALLRSGSAPEILALISIGVGALLAIAVVSVTNFERDEMFPRH